MARTHSDDYGAWTPKLEQYAALDPADPRHARLRDELMAGYLPLARNIARRFAHRGEPLDDLEQVASIGLLKALERFDISRERDFLSYAVPTVMGEVRRYFRDATWTVHTPRSIKDRYLAVGSAGSALSTTLGRAPTSAEIAEHLGLSLDEVVEAVSAHGSYRPASLDAALDGDDASTDNALVNTLAVADAGLDLAEDRATLRDLVGRLPERERAVLVLRFVHDRTQAEIGRQLCISQMHVSRLLSTTLRLLRDRVERLDRNPGALRPTG